MIGATPSNALRESTARRCGCPRRRRAAPAKNTSSCQSSWANTRLGGVPRDHHQAGGGAHRGVGRAAREATASNHEHRERGEPALPASTRSIRGLGDVGARPSGPRRQFAAEQPREHRGVEHEAHDADRQREQEVLRRNVIEVVGAARRRSCSAGLPEKLTDAADGSPDDARRREQVRQRRQAAPRPQTATTKRRQQHATRLSLSSSADSAPVTKREARNSSGGAPTARRRQHEVRRSA